MANVLGADAGTTIDVGEPRSAMTEKYQRVARIKASYDPENVFHRTVNVTPDWVERGQPGGRRTDRSRA